MGLDAPTLANAPERGGAPMSYDNVQRLIEEKEKEIAALWLEAHLESAPLSSDRETIRGVHGRSSSLIKALGRALSSNAPEDWGGFPHREVVQIFTMMVRALAEGRTTAGAAGGLAPALGKALERLGGDRIAPIVLPLAEVAIEAFTAAQLASMAQVNMERLVRTTPILKLRSGILLVAACGSPDQDTAQALVERTLRAVIKIETDAPVVLLDLSSVEDVSTETLAIFTSLPLEVAGLGGVCAVTGLDPAQREDLIDAGVDLKGVSFWGTLEQGFKAHLPEGFLRRIRRALR